MNQDSKKSLSFRLPVNRDPDPQILKYFGLDPDALVDPIFYCDRVVERKSDAKRLRGSPEKLLRQEVMTCAVRTIATKQRYSAQSPVENLCA